MRVLLAQSAHSAGSIHYRIQEPAREIRKAGFDVVTRTGLQTTMRRPADGGDPVVVDVDSEGADVVVNVSGGRGAVAQGMAAASKFSTVVLAAPGSEEISVGSVGRRNLVLKWAHGHSYASVELAIQMIASGRYPMDEISTHTFGLSQVDEAIKAVAGEGAPGAIHVSVIP